MELKILNNLDALSFQLDKAPHLDHLGLANKTPVSWLHEVCTRNNITPKYDLLQVEGVIHEPIFQYRLTLEHNGTTFEGMSQHCFAEALLQMSRCWLSSDVTMVSFEDIVNGNFEEIKTIYRNWNWEVEEGSET